MNYPSIHTIQTGLDTDKKTAKMIRGLIDGILDPLDFPGGQSRYKECFNPPTRVDLILHAVDGLLPFTFGVEYIRHVDDATDYYSSHGIEYLNAGDTYTTTLTYNHATQRYRIVDFGTLVETNARLC